MNRRASLAIVVILLILTTLACQLSDVQISTGIGSGIRGSGDIVTETRSISGVNGVDLGTFGDVIIEIGDQETLRIEAEDNLIEYFETQVRAGTLHIDTQPGFNLNPTKPVKFFLTVTELENVAISGSGDIQVPDLEADEFAIEIGGSGDVSMSDLTSERLTIDIGGSGDVTTEGLNVVAFDTDIGGSGDIDVEELNGETLSLDVNGSGNLRINGGQVNDQEIDVNGSGNYVSGDLASEIVGVRIGGSGDITVWVTGSLQVVVNGSGDVRYYGRPSVSSTGDGSGDVVSLGEK
jgi:hypothetical protein